MIQHQARGFSRLPVSVALTLCILAATIAGGIVPVRQTMATFPGANGKIVFGSFTDGNQEIFTIDADGSDLARLTDNAPWFDGDPAWSADGERIIFTSTRHGGNNAIYTMNADGSNQTRLTTSHSDAGHLDPSWSPDRSTIVFVSNRDPALGFGIYAMDADGGNQRMLADGPLFDGGPKWSPNGSKIAFHSQRDGSVDVYVMNADGSNQIRLTTGKSTHPSWSPDGSKMAFSSARDNNAGEIYVMNADGSNQTRLTDNTFLEFDPVWSPDGKQIAFLSVRDGTRGIFVMNADGSNQRLLTSGPGPIAEESLDWQANPQVELRALEVNQSVQDWHNSIPSITNKDTVVRAFVEVPDGMADRQVTGKLYGRRNGVDLPGSPLSPLNPGGAVTARPDIESRRGDLAGSLNFRLPTSWRNGTVELKFQADGTGVRCREPSGSGADPAANCMVTVTFQDVVTPEVVFVGVRYQNSGRTVEPSSSELIEQMLRFESVLPVADIDYRLDTMGNYATKPDEEAVNADLQAKWLLDASLCLETCSDPGNFDTNYYGVIVGNGGGLANSIPGTVSSGFLSNTAAKDATGYARNRGPHEYAHSLGRHHAVDTSLPTNSAGETVGQCNEVASPSAPGHTHFETVAGNVRPVLGPLSSGVDNEIWGLDTRFVSTNTNGLAVVNPRVTFELMSYCGGGPQGRWISQFTYEGLIGTFSSMSTSASTTDTSSADFILVTGTIDFEADVARVGHALEVTGNFPVPTTGDYRLELLDTDGNVLQGTSFEPIIMDADATDPESAADPATGLIVVLIPTPDVPVAGIRIVHDEREIGTLAASDSTPTVSIDTPVGGETFSDSTITFAWTGTDVDQGPLAYTVLYSTDDGETWDTLAVNTDATSLEIPRSDLAATTTARLRVIVSDGVLSSDAISERFAVSNNGPLVLIEDPSDGATYSGQQNVYLAGVAFDTENGALDGMSLNWSSDVDGVLGTGEELTVNAMDLTEGVHEITFTATDADVASSTASVTIEIFRDVPPSEPDNTTPSVTAAQPTVTVSEGQTATASGSYADADTADTVTVTASTGTINTTGTSSGTWTWSLTTTDGPAESQTVTITADDGHGGVSQTTFDLIVTNVAPVVTFDSTGFQGDSFRGEGSFVDPGDDQWSGTVDYGDGDGPQPLVLAPDHTFALAHTYPGAGSFTITVCVTDSDGAEGCNSTAVSAERFAIFAGRDTCGPFVNAFTAIGSGNTIAGNLHSNGGLVVAGSHNRVDGTTTYRCTPRVTGSRNSFSETPAQVTEVRPSPSLQTSADFDCDINVNGTLDLSRNGAWWVGGRSSSRRLAPLTLCADTITLSGTNITGEVTLVAEDIRIIGTNLRLTAHEEGVLAIASGNGLATLLLTGTRNNLNGDLVANDGQVVLFGTGTSIEGSVVGWMVSLKGTNWRIGDQ